jgi:hypothetical protein
MKLYKLTTHDHETMGPTQWGPNVTHKITSPSSKHELCSNKWLHAYLSPELAILLNPIHADIPTSDLVLWEAFTPDDSVKRYDQQLKIGVSELTTLYILPTPTITLDQRVKFAILCARAVGPTPTPTPSFEKWADAWLAGTDRTRASARAAAAEAARAAEAAWAARATRSARTAAAEAAEAEEAARAAEAEAARAAAEAAEAAARAARAAEAAARAAWAAARAAWAGKTPLDLIRLAKEALS